MSYRVYKKEIEQILQNYPVGAKFYTNEIRAQIRGDCSTREVAGYLKIHHNLENLHPKKRDPNAGALWLVVS